MATLHTLANPHFLKLSPDERMDLIRNLRTARRTKIVKPVNELAPRAKTPRKPKTQYTGDLAGLSQEQLATLLEMMNDSSN